MERGKGERDREGRGRRGREGQREGVIGEREKERWGKKEGEMGKGRGRDG